MSRRNLWLCSVCVLVVAACAMWTDLGNACDRPAVRVSTATRVPCRPVVTPCVRVAPQPVVAHRLVSTKAPVVVSRAPVVKHHKVVPSAAVPCPPVPCCCEDAKTCVQEETLRACYSEAGLTAFVALYRDAAARGVENATIRALNATKVAPDCKDCDPKKK